MQFSNDPKLDLRRTFRGPYRRRPRAASLLAVLRGDLQRIYGAEASRGGPVAAPLLAALGLCVGLELLAKYWSGRPDIVGSTVLDFLTAVARLTQPDAEALLQFRNSLAHGYALGTRRRSDNQLFSFVLDTNDSPSASVISRQGPDTYTINLWSLKRLFLAAIRECRRALSRDRTRLRDFCVCIRNLGEIAVAP